MPPKKTTVLGDAL
jgi:hypothetical protein